MPTGLHISTWVKYMHQCMATALRYARSAQEDISILLLLKYWGFLLCIIDEEAVNSLFAF